MRSGTPVWLEEVKSDARRKVDASPLTQGCAQGNMDDLKALLIGFWSFVSAFPDMIGKKYGETDDLKARILAAMEKDERSHTLLWLEACTAIGIGKEELKGEQDFLDKQFSSIREDYPLFSCLEE